MDTFQLYSTMRALLLALNSSAVEWEEKVRDGTARQTWIHDGMGKRFHEIRVRLTLWWVASDPAKTVTFNDLHLTKSQIDTLNLLDKMPAKPETRGTDAVPERPATPADYVKAMKQRNRGDLEDAFRSFHTAATPADAITDIGAQLDVIYAAMAAAENEAMALIDTVGAVSTQEYVDVGGIVHVQGKPFADLGVGTTALADKLHTIQEEISKLITVV